MGDFRRNSGRRCAEKVLFVPMMTFMPCCLLVGGECRFKSSMDSGIRLDRAEDSEEGKIAAAWSHFPAQQCYHQEEFYCSGFLLRTAERNNAKHSAKQCILHLIPHVGGGRSGRVPNALDSSTHSNQIHSTVPRDFDVGAMALLPSLLVIFSCSRASWGSNSVWRLMRSAHFLFGGY